MDNYYIQLVGGPCGQHGPYTFYKAFKYMKNGAKHIMTLSEFFFVKLWMDSDLVCIGELQLLWVDKNSEQVLASLRLYFLPENTPEGRMDHGEDEVLAISEKVVLRVEDLITWITLDAEWGWGRLARFVDYTTHPADVCEPPISACLTESSLDFSDVDRERKLSDIKPFTGPAVIILSYPRYCRYRAVLKRLDGFEDEDLKYRFVNALGGIRVKNHNTRILYCRETFDYPELEGHELLCNHLAPKLKGRPRGKRKKRCISPGSESNESESSVSNVFTSGKNKLTISAGRNGLRCDTNSSTRRRTRASECNTESKDFIKQLSAFMKNNKTPIGRIPSLGYKEIDLYAFYTKVERLGGYDSVTQNRLWKSIFDDLSGNLVSTSAATVIRRHYERFLLPYEKHLKGEEYKPLAVTERRRLKSKNGSSTTSVSDAETSEGTSRSGNSTPVPQVPAQTPGTPVDGKDYSAIKVETTKSLRSVRVKPHKDLMAQSQDDIAVPCKEALKIPEKHPEPSTGAVAPVQIHAPAMSTSPVEGKENIPIFSARSDGARNDEVDEGDLVEVPYKPKSPEIIDLDSDKYSTKSNNNNNNNTITSNNNNCTTNNKNAADVRKGKLDILKEGGLEVTPVRHFPAQVNVVRTSSIHKMTKEKQHMPPPSINATLIKRPPPQVTPPAANKICTLPPNAPLLPPRVVQSKSIFAPSQRMVYGDPNDIIQPQNRDVVVCHKYMGPPRPMPPVPAPICHKPVTDLLDLTTKSPQKATTVDIMPVTTIKPHPVSSSPNLPLLEGRRLNNLEITLVNPSAQQHHVSAVPPTMLSPNTLNSMPPHFSPYKKHITPHVRRGRIPSSSPTYNPKPLPQYPPQRVEAIKRPITDYYPPTSSKIPCMDQNHKPQQIHAIPQNIYPVKPKIKYPATPNVLFPNYPMPTPPPPSMSSVKGAGIPPHFPLVDPMYYQSLSSLYPQLTAGHVYPPMPHTADNVQYFNELMARSRMPGYLGFPLHSETHASLTAAAEKMKKP